MPLRPKPSTRRKRLPRRPPVPRSLLDWVLAIVCAVLIALAVVSIGGSSTGSAATRRTATVGRGVVQSTVSGNGSLEAAQQVELNFGASGEVTAIEVKAGEEVKKGQVLARVDASSARASLASAEAQLSEAEESLESAEEAEEEEGESEETAAAYEGGATAVLAGYMAKAGTIEEGSGSKGEVTPETASPETTSPRSTSQESSATEEPEGAGEASAEIEAAAPSGGGESSGATGEGSGATGEASGATVEAGGATGEASASASGGAASVSVPTARANLREAQLSVRSARQEVRETTLRAPISGSIASISGTVGEDVSGEASSGSATGGASESSSAGALGATGGESTSSSSGSAFVVLAQLRRLKMEVSFSESDIGKVEVGQTATVAVDSLEGTELSGRVTTVDVLPSEGSSSVVEYPATILLTQSAPGLRAGMSASAEVIVEQVKDATTVSSEAITAGPTKTVTVSRGGREVEKTVTTGLVGDETTQILSGVKAGETVVLPEVTVAAAGGEGAAVGGEAGGFPGAAGGGLPGGFTGTPPAGFPGGG